MAKKKNNQTVVNNIESVNMEIDYDKLAEVIVKAQQKAQEVNSPSRELMKYILVPAFICVAVFSGLLSIVMFVTLIKNVTAVFDTGVLNGIVIVLLEFFISFF